MPTSTTVLQAPVLKPAIMASPSEGQGSPPAQASPIPPEAQHRIEELEAQVKILTLRATSAVERATDLEDALRTLTSQKPTSPPHRPSTANGPKSSRNGIPPTPYIAPQQLPHSTAPAVPINTRTSLSRLLPLRRAASTSTNVPSPPAPSSAPLSYLIPYNPTPPPSASAHQQQHPQSALLPPIQDLLQALENERTLRLEAEKKVEQSQAEVEELTGQLFQEANEMVAEERRARAKAEERVRELEGRGKRIEALEGRLGRIERLRRLVGGQEGEGEKEGEKEVGAGARVGSVG